MGSAIQSVGSQVLPKGSTIIGVSYSSFYKAQDGMTAGTRESHHHAQFDLDVAHGVSESLMLRATLPYIYKSLAATGEDTMKTQGLGDLNLGATFQLKPKSGDKVLIAFTGDLKLPTGKNNLKDSAGDRMEEHSQLGTGSTDFVLGIQAASGCKSGLTFGGLRYRMNGSNDTHYRYGNVVFYNVGYSHKLDANSSVVLEWNGRIAKKDRMDDGSMDDNSGGHFGYLSLSYRKSITPDLGLIGSVQLPVIRNLNGSQTESGLITIGIYKKL